MSQQTESIFGSKTRSVVLEEVAKATEPLSASSVSRAAGIDAKNVYQEVNRLKELGIFNEIPIGKNQKGYKYSDSPEAKALLEFVRTVLSKRSQSLVEKVANSFPASEYYISLPIALRISFDVFYSPSYLLLLVDKRMRDATTEFVRRLGPDGQKIILKVASLRGREFNYDEAFGASLASNEQAIADGLNYYENIRDKEIIRTLLTRFEDIDLESVERWLNSQGANRLRVIMTLRNGFFADRNKQNALADYQARFLEFINKRYEERPVKGSFKWDLKNEAIPSLLPNDQTDRENAFKLAAEKVSSIIETA